MSFQPLFDSLKSFQFTEEERIEDYIIVKVTEDNWYGGGYIAYSSKWDYGKYIQHDTLEEARKFITEVNSKDPISPEFIYNSKVIQKTKEIPSWLSEYIGLNWCSFDDIDQSDVTIKIHNYDKENILLTVMSVWYLDFPIMVGLRGVTDKSGTDEVILVTDKENYNHMVSYLFCKFQDKKLLDVVQTLPINPNKDISLMWGYFIEDLLEKE